MRDFSPSEREALLRADRAAWGDVCTWLAPRVALLLRLGLDARLRARVDVDDLTQEVLLQVAGRRLDPGERGQALMAWVRKAVRHACVDAHRMHVEALRRSVDRERRGDELARRLPTDGTSPTGAARRQERVVALHEALERLRPEDRQVLVARVLEGLSLAETATLMERSPGAVGVLQHRALARLKRIYRGSEPTGVVA